MKGSQLKKRKKKEYKTQSILLPSHVNFPPSVPRCASHRSLMHLRIYEFIPTLPRAPLLGPTSQYRMHFGSRPSRFAIPFVRGSFSRQILALDLAPRPLVHPRRECFTPADDVYPECIPVCKSREKRDSATNWLGYR